MQRTILTIEDDPAIRRGVADALEFHGYVVVESASVAEGMPLALAGEYDLLLLDVVLPDGDGLEILYRLRELRPRQPVIVLTARGAERDRVGGLRMGADDYVVKPFHVNELLARVEAVLRRSPVRNVSAPIAVNGRGMISPAGGEFVGRDDRRVELSAREIQLVVYLSEHAGRTVSREEILERVWGIDPRGVSTRTIDMHVARLREKLGDDPADPQVILTVRGRGYRWREA